MSVNRIYNDRHQFFDSNGDPLNGGKLFFYIAGSSTKQDTFNSSAGTVPNSNPMVLDSAGRLQTECWLTDGEIYKQVLTNSTDSDPPASPIWTEDNISGINDSTVTLDQWIVGPAPTFVSATSFTLVGDQTTAFHVGRAVKMIDSSGENFSRIKTSAYTTLTTLTIEDSILDSGLSSVSYGIITATNNGLPSPFDTNPIAVDQADITKKFREEVGTYVLTGTTVVGTVPSASGIHSWTSEPTGLVQFPSMWMQGLVLSNNAGDATNDLDFTAGQCRDATNARNIVVAALTKRSDATFVVGTNQGTLDAGAIGNNEYYVFAILRSDTGVTDILCSLSSTAPTMPTNYDYKRLVGYFLRVGGTIVAFKAYESEGGGLDWLWSSPTLDINLANTLTTSRRTDAVKVPLTFSTVAHIFVQCTDATTAAQEIIYSPDMADITPTAALANYEHTTATAQPRAIFVRTSAAGLIAARSTLATVDGYSVHTIGFNWARRN